MRTVMALRRRMGLVVLVASMTVLSGCAHHSVPAALDRLLPADVLLVGEQHDADAHQRLQHDLISELTARGVLAALVLEMADRGGSTSGLPPDASDEEVRAALRWDLGGGWDWARYRPAVLAAVRARVPVLGGNLPRTALRDAMAEPRWDVHLQGEALQRQRQAIVSGHCDLLPAAQIGPMLRAQVARDAAMAATVAEAVRPGATVVLIAGGGHVRRDLGVPTHLPTTLRTRVLLGVTSATDVTHARADLVVATVAPPHKDHCAELRQRLRR